MSTTIGGPPADSPENWGLPRPAQNAPAGKAGKVLGGIKNAGVQPGTRLPFSARAKETFRFLTEHRREAKKIGAKGNLAAKILSSTKHMQRISSLDVRELGQKEFTIVKNMMEKYHNLGVGAGNMMANEGVNRDFGWIPFNSEGLPRVDEVKGPSSKAISAFIELKEKLRSCGFITNESNKNSFYHPATGTDVAVLYNKESTEISLFFPGLGGGPQDKGFFTRLGQIIAESLGGKTKSTELCLQLGEALKSLNNKNGISFSVAGHSHGGNLAQTVALTAGIKGVCFNSRCISGTTQERIRQTNPEYAQNKEKITHFNKHGCWVTDNPTLNLLARVYAAITGKPVATRVGKEHYVPTDGKGAIESHNETHWPAELMKPTHSRRKSLGPEEIGERA